MIKEMKKINFKKLFSILLLLSILIYLKTLFANYLDTGNIDKYIRDVLAFVGDNPLMNVIWLLPLVITIFLISNTFYYKMLKFNTRYGNRKTFILKNIIIFIFMSFIFNFFIALTQELIFIIISRVNINYLILYNSLHYTIENVFIDLLIICGSMLIKNYMISFTTTLLVILVSLNLSKDICKKIPYINMFYESNINIYTVILIIVLIILLYKLYLNYDIEGGKSNEN